MAATAAYGVIGGTRWDEREDSPSTSPTTLRISSPRQALRFIARIAINRSPQAQRPNWFTLGFEQCAAAYRLEIGVPAEQMELHRRYLARVLHDPKVAISLFENVQYLAHHTC